MKYIIKSVLFNDYFISLRKINKTNFKTSWSQFKEDAKRFDTYKKASDAAVFLFGLHEEDLQLTIEKDESLD